VSHLKIKILSKNMREKPTNATIIHSVYQLCILSSQLSIAQKAVGTLPEDGNLMPKHVGDTIHN
jgi:protein involved in temperature-dependent protein secretion